MLGYVVGMTYDDIVTALKASDLPPEAALRAAVPYADTLAPEVYARLAKYCRGVHLLLPDSNLLFYGLHVLAAARHDGLWPRLLEIARLEQEELDELFPGRADTTLARMMLSVWDGDANALCHLIEHADMGDDAKWALFDVLARLTFDGRILRAQTVAFLERFEREGLADSDSQIWWGWENAVTRLGLIEFEPALQRVWTKTVYAISVDIERITSLEELEHCRSNPADPSVFIENDITPINDPVEALAWIELRIEAMAAYAAEHDATTAEPEPATADDPAAANRLSPAHENWLSGFLTSRQVPPSTMSLEMLDGYFTALAIGPAIVPPDEYLAAIWGDDDGETCTWDSEEQATEVMALFVRHWNAIAMRAQADALHRPLLADYDDDESGSEWAGGFMIGVDLRGKEWEPMWDDPRGEDILFTIAALNDYGGNDDHRADIPPLSNEVRAKTLEQLPATLKRIAAFWRDPDRRFRGPPPVRVTKVGRNDPCPCGSGKKYKKCCGLKPPPVVH